MKKVLIVCWLLLLVGGCVSGIDPVTGEQTVGVDPNIAAKIEGGAQVAVSLLTILGALWPVLIPIGTGLAAVLVTWAKVRPKVTAAQSEASMYHSATESVVTAIEDFKEKYPDEWDKLKAEFTHTIGTNAENVIRAIRGLPPKE